MPKFRLCMLFFVNAATSLLTVSQEGITKKYVCPGDSVQAFQNIAFDRCNALVSLHTNGKRNTEIATWLWRNCTLNATLIKEYTDRLFFDLNGTITIHNIHHFDQGKYVVISKKDTLPSIKEVHINVMAAPRKDCKPTIDRFGNKLLASLKPGDCGTPIATVYWKGFGGVPDTNGPTLKITQGTESRTYYACIQGPALQCAQPQMPLENCSSYLIEGVPSESSNTLIYIGIIIVVGFLLILAIVAIVILILKHRKKKSLNGEHSAGLLEAPCPKDKHFDDVNADHAESLKLCENDRENTRTHGNDQQQGVETPSDTEVEMNEVGADHPSDIDPETIRELQELRDAAVCKICFANKTSVFFRPCNHVATCDKCSISLDNCPVCRASIKERKKLCFDSNE